jgi:AbrB family looped-hinge helix DNA binding protein
MPKVSSKRQITLPVSQCKELGIRPGDEVESFVADGQLTIVKKLRGSAKGLLKDIEPNSSISDESSRQSAIS